MTTEERRKYTRIAFHTPATLVLPEGNLDVVVIDLSLKGALVRLPDGSTVADNTECKLFVHLDLKVEEIVMVVRVVHAEGRYAGLRCVSIDLDSVTHLRRLVELNLGDTELLERELSALIAD
jgi:hypothetical protein